MYSPSSEDHSVEVLKSDLPLRQQANSQREAGSKPCALNNSTAAGDVSEVKRVRAASACLAVAPMLPVKTIARGGSVAIRSAEAEGNNKTITIEWLGSDLSACYKTGFRPSP
jgi:hypothetical protein